MPEDTREKDADYAAGKQMPLHGSQNVEAVYQDTVVEDDTVELMMQYDEQAKKILGYKTILAFILSKAVAEFKGMLLSDIAELIEGEVLINKVPVDASHTNMTKGERITGEMRDEADEAVSNDNDGKVLCNMLNTLFATNIKDKERFEKLTHDFQITLDNDLREDMKAMCNLGQGLLEKGEIRGVGKKEIENIVSFYMDGDSVERLARVMKKSETEIRQVLVDQGISLEH